MTETVDWEVAAWYRRMSAGGTQFQGLSILKYAKQIRRLVRETESKRLLDYGCGLGHQWTEKRFHTYLDVPMPKLYDPGVNGLEKKPAGKFDGVLCSDVLEHVPERLVDNVIAELFAYADRFVWASVCCRPAKKTFSDGVTNLHLTIKPEEWWRASFAAHGGGRCRCELVFTP